MVNRMNSVEPWRQPSWIEQTQRILDSFEKYLGRPLLERTGQPDEEARRLFEAPFIVVSHGTQADPIFNYGNRAALDLWEMTLEEWVILPSRLSAEPIVREDRAELLARALEKGYAADYRGIRVSKTGKRFLMEDAIIWNLVDGSGVRRGQAATFAKWTPLEPRPA